VRPNGAPASSIGCIQIERGCDTEGQSVYLIIDMLVARQQGVGEYRKEVEKSCDQIAVNLENHMRCH
jgi:hypothetical protein